MRSISAATVLAVAASAVAHAAPLSSVFSDHMVVKRDAPIAVWGAAAPGATVTVAFAGMQTEAQADASGAWRAELPSLAAGGPYAFEVATSAGGRQTVSDVLVGDVYLCSGQSNMEYPVGRAMNSEPDVAGPHAADLRLLKIEKHASPTPLANLGVASSWAPASPESVANFSAVCFYAARDLKADGVPMGLVDSTWGGSQLEAWMSVEALDATGLVDDGVRLLKAYPDDPDAAFAGFGDWWMRWWREAADGSEPWLEVGDEGWTPAPASLGDWKEWGDPALADLLGMVWHRARFDLPADYDGAPVTLNLGRIDERDAVWVNGQFAAAAFGWGTQRRYVVDGAKLRPGSNVVVVNVSNTWARGGIITEDADLDVRLANGAIVPLDDWRYRMVPREVGGPPRLPWESVGGLATLYDAMIHPLVGLRLSGLAWYQGESNAGRAEEYEPLLSAYVADMRARFGADLPVVVVQLPNFGGLPFDAGATGWAPLREAQRRAAVADAGVGLAVAIDVGDRYDLHPPNKQAVGARVARAMSALQAGDAATADGPQPTAARRSGRAIRISFANADAGLRAVGGDGPNAVELCDAGGACRYAATVIEGASLRVVIPQGLRPATVRYCWGDAPICTLFEGDADVPVSPFEMAVE